MRQCWHTHRVYSYERAHRWITHCKSAEPFQVNSRAKPHTPGVSLRHAALRQVMHSRNRHALHRFKGEAGTDTNSQSGVWCAPADHARHGRCTCSGMERGRRMRWMPLWGGGAYRWVWHGKDSAQHGHAVVAADQDAADEELRRECQACEGYTMSHQLLASLILTRHKVRMGTRCNDAQAAEHVQKAAPSGNCFASAPATKTEGSWA